MGVLSAGVADPLPSFYLGAVKGRLRQTSGPWAWLGVRVLLLRGKNLIVPIKLLLSYLPSSVNWCSYIQLNCLSYNNDFQVAWRPKLFSHFYPDRDISFRECKCTVGELSRAPRMRTSRTYQDINFMTQLELTSVGITSLTQLVYACDVILKDLLTSKSICSPRFNLSSFVKSIVKHCIVH